MATAQERTTWGRSGSVAPVRKELLGLGLDALLDDAPAVRVAGKKRGGRVLHLLERGVWRDGRHVGVGVDVEERRPVGAKGLVPGVADLGGIGDRVSLQAE